MHPIDPELLKPLLERRVLEAGARILYLTQVADAMGFEKGDPQTGELQPVTPCFVMANVDVGRYFEWQEARPGRQNVKDAIARAKAAGDLDIPEGHITAAGGTTPRSLGFNFGHVFEVDGSDARQLSDAQVEGRRPVEHLAKFVRKYCAGCEDGVLAATGVTIGVRETRRIVGEYRLTADDYFARRCFEDEILRNAYYLTWMCGRCGTSSAGTGRGCHRHARRPAISPCIPGGFVEHCCLAGRGRQPVPAERMRQ